MINKKLVFPIIAFIFSSCTYLDKGKEDNLASQVVLGDEIHKEEEEFIKKKHESLNEVADLPVCDGCIVGSSPSAKEDFKEGKIVYHLDSIDGHKLTNQHFDFPVVDNSYVRWWVRYFLGKGREWFVRSAERAGRYAPILSEILEENGLPRDLIYLAMAESGFHNKALSWALAAGPWQFIASTGKKYGLHIGWYVDERLDPIKASFASSKYLKDLYGLFQSWELAAAAYNAGEGRVLRATRRYRTTDFWRIRRRRGILRSETKNYVPKIMALAIIGKNLRTFGFNREVEFQKSLSYEVVHVGESSDLYKVSEDLNISFEELKKWNPELRRWQTPAGRSFYPLRVPVGMRSAFKDCCSEKDYTAKDYQRYVIKSYGSLKSIARKYKVPVDLLADLNKEKTFKTYKKGEEVILPFRIGQSTRDRMYRDLYLRKKRRRRSRGVTFDRRIAMARKYGKKIANPSEYYTVKKGDTLWDVAKKTGISINTLIKSNMSKVRSGYIHPGQQLVVR